MDPFIRDARQRYRDLITPPKRLPDKLATGKMVERAVNDEALLRWMRDIGQEMDLPALVALAERDKPGGIWSWPRSDQEAGAQYYRARVASKKGGFDPPAPPDKGPVTDRSFTLPATRQRLQERLERLVVAGFVRRRKEGRRVLYGLSPIGILFSLRDSPLVFEANTYRTRRLFFAGSEWKPFLPLSRAHATTKNPHEVHGIVEESQGHEITTYDAMSARDRCSRADTGYGEPQRSNDEGSPLRDERDEVFDREKENPLRDHRAEAGLNGSLHDAPLDDKGFYSELRRRLEALDRRDSEPRDSNGKDETNEERDPLKIFSSRDRE